VGPRTLALGKKKTAKNNSFSELGEINSIAISDHCENLDAVVMEPT
jgi:hypothetical protein